jgi:hypothetical protein
MCKFAVISIVAAASCGCISAPGPFGDRHAIVNDVSVKAPLDSGYRVVAVDGKPAERARSAVVTVVPFVLVQAGEHKLSLEPKNGESLAATDVTATFDSGKRYRIQRENGVVSVIEEAE